MKNMMDEGGHEELAVTLAEFYAPLGSKTFIIIGMDLEQQVAVSPVGWKPSPALMQQVLEFCATNKPIERFTIK